jgi:hypothetical protein
MTSSKPRRTWLWILAAGGLLALSVCALGGYWLWQTLVGPPPGVGPAAERGYQACAPIIDALARYQADHGQYPAELAALAPGYVPTLPGVDGLDIHYQPQGTGYRLEFRYAGPGMNVCVYTPDQGWDCYGYY